jgi:hypothetical protein
MTSISSLPAQLTTLVNACMSENADVDSVRKLLRNFEALCEEFRRPLKDLMILAVEKESALFSDVIHATAHLAKLLLGASHAPACDDAFATELARKATSLIAVMTWIPRDNAEKVLWCENWEVTTLLFETAWDAREREREEPAVMARNALIGWTIEAGAVGWSWNILERGLQALSALALLQQEEVEVGWLKAQLVERLRQENAPSEEIRDGTARSLRREATSLRVGEFELDSIKRGLGSVDRVRARQLLTDLANILSPGTADEPIRDHWP